MPRFFEVNPAVKSTPRGDDELSSLFVAAHNGRGKGEGRGGKGAGGCKEVETRFGIVERPQLPRGRVRSGAEVLEISRSTGVPPSRFRSAVGAAAET
ncbi:hypothetical protein KM043_005460 [Ampulex compressa]|nr:hypothetical protein KM043_005460 [Ampulex compressa]